MLAAIGLPRRLCEYPAQVERGYRRERLCASPRNARPDIQVALAHSVSAHSLFLRIRRGTPRPPCSSSGTHCRCAPDARYAMAQRRLGCPCRWPSATRPDPTPTADYAPAFHSPWRAALVIIAVVEKVGLLGGADERACQATRPQPPACIELAQVRNGPRNNRGGLRTPSAPGPSCSGPCHPSCGWQAAQKDYHCVARRPLFQTGPVKAPRYAAVSAPSPCL